MLFGAEFDPGGKVRSPLPKGMLGAALFHGAQSEYRLLLYRGWTGAPCVHYRTAFGHTRVPDPLGPFPFWIGMNPSTATEHVNDPTITRVIGFCRVFGYSEFMLGNIGDYRSTSPKALAKVEFPCSELNADVLLETAQRAHRVILCYGEAPQALSRFRDQALAELRVARIPLYCLGRTKAGHPRHPLMLKRDTALEPWAGT